MAMVVACVIVFGLPFHPSKFQLRGKTIFPGYFSFSTEDHLALAIVYLKICELEQAGGELSNLSKVGYPVQTIVREELC